MAIKHDNILENPNMMKALRDFDKVAMVKDLGLEGKIDFAVPVEWSKRAMDLQIDVSPIVWSYDEDRIFGKPLNIVNEWHKKFGKKISSAIYALRHS